MIAPDYDAEKRAAAAASLEYVRDGMKIGLGSGSTSRCFVELLGEKVKQGLKVVGVPTSETTRTWAQTAGIPLTTLNETPRLDLAIDGADETTADGSLIKGGGGALLREKIVETASAQLVVIVDSRKLVEKLGAFPLPVEVVQFALKPVELTLQEMQGNPILRVQDDGTPFITDEGNFILDCHFGVIEAPVELATTLAAIPGVVEHGLFVGLTDVVIIGAGDTVRKIEVTC